MKKLLTATVFILFLSVDLQAQDVQNFVKEEVKVETSHNCGSKVVEPTKRECNHSPEQKAACQTKNLEDKTESLPDDTMKKEEGCKGHSRVEGEKNQECKGSKSCDHKKKEKGNEKNNDKKMSNDSTAKKC